MCNVWINLNLQGRNHDLNFGGGPKKTRSPKATSEPRKAAKGLGEGASPPPKIGEGFKISRF
jgi:hypothetical protein